MQDWTDDSEILRLMKDAKANEDRLKTLYQQMYHNLFSYLTDSQHSLFGTQEADDYSKLMGPFRLNFAKVTINLVNFNRSIKLQLTVSKKHLIWKPISN